MKYKTPVYLFLFAPNESSHHYKKICHELDVNSPENTYRDWIRNLETLGQTPQPKDIFTSCNEHSYRFYKVLGEGIYEATVQPSEDKVWDLTGNSFKDSIDRARALAAKAHYGHRYGNFPYIVHLDATANVAYRYRDLLDPQIALNALYMGCYLHDAIEDTGLSGSSISKYLGNTEFAESIVSAIFSCTAPRDCANRKERMNQICLQIRGRYLATAIKLCDRIANIEHGLEHNSPQVEMYLQEMSEFKAKAQVPGVCDALWNKLDQLAMAQV